MLCLLLAQSSIDPIAGGAGWVGAGLLGLVLSWLLLVHLPAKDKQLKEFMDSKDTHIASLTEKYEKKLELVTLTFEKEATEARNDFKRTLDIVMGHCTDETKKIIDAFRQEIRRKEETER